MKMVNFHVGETFDTFQVIKSKVAKFGQDNFFHTSKRSSRKIAASLSWKTCEQTKSYAENILYSELWYVYVSILEAIIPELKVIGQTQRPVE